jgi:hypothetical protein
MVRNEIIDETRLFDIDEDLLIRASKKKSPQLYIEKKNMREALISALRPLNAVPRLRYDQLNSKWVLDADFLNQRKLPFDLSNYIDWQSEASGENFAQNAQIFHENTISEEPETNVYAQSIQDTVSWRSNEIIVGESNQKLILSYPIERLKNFIAIVQASDNQMYELDLSDYIYELNVYNSLDFKGGVGTKEYACYWTYKNNEIDGLNEAFNIFGTKMAYRNILDYALQDQFGKNMGYYTSAVFKVEYKPYIENMRSEQMRLDRNPYELTDDMFDEYSALLINQQERLNELHDLTSNIFGQIQRLGVDTISTSKKHYDLSAYSESNQDGIYSIGDYTPDGYFVTKVERVYYPTYAIARYELSKNWNRISQFVQVSKEFRAYEIALAKTNYTLKRDVLLPIGYVEISPELKEEGAQLQQIREYFMDTFAETTRDLPYYFGALMYNDYPYFPRDHIVGLPLQLLAEKNAIKFKLDFNDTKLAGKKISTNDIEDEITKNQEGVYYTNEQGRAEYIKPALLYSLWDRADYNTNAEAEISMANEFPNFVIQESDKKRVVINPPTNSLKTIYEVYVRTNYDDYDAKEKIEGEYYLIEEPSDGWPYDNYVIQYRPDLPPENIRMIGEARGIQREIDYELPMYKIMKDTSEILGLEMYLPIYPDTDYIDNIIVGEEMTKDNALLVPKDIPESLYWQVRDEMFDRSVTDNIGKVEDASLSYTFDPSTELFDKYIDVFDSVWNTDKNYALTNYDGDLYFAVNQNNYDGSITTIDKIYFNFNQDIFTINLQPEANVYIGAEATMVINAVMQEYFSTDTIINGQANMNVDVEVGTIQETTAIMNAFANMNLSVEKIEFETNDVDIVIDGIANMNWSGGESENIWTETTAQTPDTTQCVSDLSTTINPLPNANNFSAGTILKRSAYNLTIVSPAPPTWDETIEVDSLPANSEEAETMFANSGSSNYSSFTTCSLTNHVIRFYDPSSGYAYYETVYPSEYYEAENQLL